MNEFDLELATLNWLQSLGYQLVYGPDIAPARPGSERTDYAQVILVGRLKDALHRINPNIPKGAVEDAL